MEQQLGVDAVVVEDAIASGAVDVQLVCKPDHAAALDSQLFENVLSYGWDLWHNGLFSVCRMAVGSGNKET